MALFILSYACKTQFLKFIFSDPVVIDSRAKVTPILQDLDERHLFVAPDAVDRIREKIDDLMDAVSVPVVDGGSGGGEGQRRHRR